MSTYWYDPRYPDPQSGVPAVSGRQTTETHGHLQQNRRLSDPTKPHGAVKSQEVERTRTINKRRSLPSLNQSITTSRNNQNGTFETSMMSETDQMQGQVAGDVMMDVQMTGMTSNNHQYSEAQAAAALARELEMMNLGPQQERRR